MNPRASVRGRGTLTDQTPASSPAPCDKVRGMSGARATCSLLRTAALVLPALAAAACGVALPTPAADLPARESAPAQAPAPTATPTPTPTPAPGSATHQAMVSFGTPIADAALQTLLSRRSAKPVTAYMTTNGFFGTFRHAEPLEPAAFIALARSETATSFGEGEGGGATTRAKDFVDSHTAQEVAADPDAQERARGLLGLHSRLESAKNAAAAAPLIYALEVRGAEPQLRQLSADARVVEFHVLPVDSEERLDWPSNKFIAERQPVGGASGAEHLDAATLYARLDALARRATATPTPTPTATPAS